MCLEVVTEKGLDLEGEGWKVFKKEWDGKQVSGEFHDNVMDFNIWISKGNVPGDRTRMTPVDEKYPLGFHVFEHEEDAEEWISGTFGNPYVVLKVKYRGGHTKGSVWGFNGSRTTLECVVADEIFIMKEGEEHGND